MRPAACQTAPRCSGKKPKYAVFGDQIDVYDIAQAVQDGATVPIYYEARVAKIEIAPELEDMLDQEFDDATAGIDAEASAATARRWARVEALVGAEKRLDTVVADILEHFDRRQKAIEGKAMIVCMSRQIAAKVYQRIVAARPDWHSDMDADGACSTDVAGCLGFRERLSSPFNLPAIIGCSPRAAAASELARRSALSAHERIAEVRERRRIREC